MQREMDCHNQLPHMEEITALQYICTVKQVKLSMHLLPENYRAVKYAMFEVWNNCIPHIHIASPKDDVCVTCEKSWKKVMMPGNGEEKMLSFELTRQHILAAQNDHDLYNDYLPCNEWQG